MGINDTLNDFRLAAQPGAGTVMCQVTVPADGYYEIDSWFQASGTLAAIDNSNVGLWHGASQVTTLIGVQGTGSNSEVQLLRLDCAAGDVITLRTIQGATILSSYHCKLSVTRIGGAS